MMPKIPIDGDKYRRHCPTRRRSPLLTGTGLSVELLPEGVRAASCTRTCPNRSHAAGDLAASLYGSTFT